MTFLGTEKPSLEDVIEHHGVKGQKWGVRRADRVERHAELSERVASGNASGKDKAISALTTPVGRLAVRGLKGGAAKNAQVDRKFLAKQEAKSDKKIAKKLAKNATAKEREDFYNEKANHILAVAMADHDSLIALRTHNDAVIVTGKQFIDHMASGGLMNINATDVYATRAKTTKGKSTGPYILNPNINAPFVPSSKK